MSTQATLSIIPYSESLCVGEEVPVQVMLSVTGDAVNAAQGMVRFDPTQLRITSVHTGRSIFRFWPTQPVVHQKQGTITFAGGLPTPGFTGRNGLLFTINAVPKGAGADVRLSWDSSALVLLNDGQGTPADLLTRGTQITVQNESELACAVPRTTPTPLVDTTSPEPFEVVIARTDQGFQGQYFASFYAYDADSGIARYEVRENSEPWHIEKSPYRLRLQQGQMLLEVRAIDASGNERISSTSMLLTDGEGVYMGPWWFWIIIACTVAAALWRVIVGRRKDSNVQNDSNGGASDTPVETTTATVGGEQ